MFPITEPYAKHMLEVGDGHILYIEESGNPDGIPIVCLHGGPGDGTRDRHKQIYNPYKFKIICYAQRGCGQSLPSGSLLNNTTQDLIEDLEKIRRFLKIDKWMIHGASWGASLGLLYSYQYPESCSAILLNNLALISDENNNLNYIGNHKAFFPEERESLLSQIPVEHHKDMKGYITDQILTGQASVGLVKAFQKRVYASLKLINGEWDYEDDGIISDSLKIYMHYVQSDFFIKDGDMWSSENIDKVRHIPTILLHSRYDLCCPYGSTAYKLSQNRPEAKLVMVEGAGHRTSEPEISNKLIELLEIFADNLLLGK